MKKINVFMVWFLILFSVACLCPCRHFDPLNNGKGVAVSADGSDILYEVKGEGDVALVFVHGWSCDRSYWDNQLDYFAKKDRVVAVDLAGHGASSLTRKNYTIESFADDVVAVVNRLKLKQVILIGHSMGGYVIVEAEKQLKDKVIGLIPIDTLENVSARFPENIVKNFIGGFESDFKKTTTGFVKGLFAKNSKPELVEKVVNDMSSAPKLVAISAFLNLADYNNNTLMGRLDGFDKPVISINTDLNPTNVKENKKYFGNYNVVIMKGLGHFPMLEDVNGFNDILEQVILDLINN